MKHNDVRLIGYVADCPKVYRSKNGSKRAILRVATHDKFKSDGENPKYGTMWHDVIAWDKVAELAEKSFVKGSQILVSGMLNQRKYIDGSGKMRYITDIKADYLKNLDR